ncbi:MAG: aminopeptidase P N-terminal domain-containing protein, partial [Pyrinomonadaceae bacterium]
MSSTFLAIALLFTLIHSTPIVAFERISTEPSEVRITPPAPRFTDAERQAELARRRAAVASKMADKSVMVLFSAEPKLYTNDVNYVFRQENNLYYLTAFKQPGATLIIRKNGADAIYTLFIRKRNPQFETWNGRMYSNEEAQRISGLSSIRNNDQLEPALKSIRERTEAAIETLYLLLPATERDSDGLREFGQEAEFAKQSPGYKV